MNFETGDLLLYHGTKTFFDKCLECVIHTKYTHVAMIIVIPNPAFIDTTLENGFYVIESTRTNKPDAEDHKIKFGVQMTKLSDVFSEIGQEIYYKKMYCARDNFFYERLKKAHDMSYKASYNLNLLDWINAAEFSWFNHLFCCSKKQKTNTFWCSALIAYILVQMNFLPENTPWTIISPKDFDSKNKKSNIHFINCYSAQEIKLK